MKKSLPKPPTPSVVAHRIAKRLTNDFPKIVKRLPEPPFFLQKKIGEKVLGNLMAEQIEMGEFDFLQDKWLKLNINDMDLSFFLTFADDKLVLSNQVEQADVIFSGNSREFVLLASRSEDPDTLFFQRRLVIEGDTELGLYIKNVIDSIDFDNWPTWLNTSVAKIASLVSDSLDSTNLAPHQSHAQNAH